MNSEAAANGVVVAMASSVAVVDTAQIRSLMPKETQFKEAKMLTKADLARMVMLLSEEEVHAESSVAVAEVDSAPNGRKLANSAKKTAQATKKLSSLPNNRWL